MASSIRIKARKSRSSGSGEHSIDAVTVASFEVIAIHPMLGLHVANDRLDGGPAFHLALDRRRHPSLLALGVDLELVAQGSVVTLVSGIGQLRDECQR